MNKRFQMLAAALTLALVALACGFGSTQSGVKIKAGAAQKADIRVSMPEPSADGIELTLQFIAGKLTLAPGAADALASGTAVFNAVELEPKTEVSGSSYKLYQGDPAAKALPTIEGDIQNEWDLHLANRPVSLTINAGPYEGNFELGGLSLENLTISEVGSNLTAAFSKPNLVEMSTFAFSTGGSKVNLRGLANANFERMTFASGAGDYTLSFDGDLKRDAAVKIDSGMSTTTIIVPTGVNARVTFDGGLTSIKMDGGWQQNGNVYTLAGSGPTISITVTMGAGTLNLQTQ